MSWVSELTKAELREMFLDSVREMYDEDPNKLPDFEEAFIRVQREGLISRQEAHQSNPSDF